ALQFGDRFDVEAEDIEKLHKILNNYKEIKSIIREGNKYVVTLTENTNSAALNKYLLDNGIIPSHLSIKKKSFEKQFLELLAKSK
ncbi:MAG: ABC transporter ATP-binding protein, partial [Bacteroidetes bacterium HGW-Bacteroidetes-15]